MTEGAVLVGSGLLLGLLAVSWWARAGAVGALVAAAGTASLWAATRLGLPGDHVVIWGLVVTVGLALGVAVVGGVYASYRAVRANDETRAQQHWRRFAGCVATALIVLLVLPHTLA